MSVVIEYQRADSFVHHLNPLTKMVWALAVMTISILFTDYVALAVLLGIILGAALLGKVMPAVAKAYKGLVIFAFILLLIQVFFYREGYTVFHLLPIGEGYLSVTDQGLKFGLSMALRMLVIVTSFLIVLTTTRTQDMMAVLVEKVKLPNDIAMMILMSIRFIPSFLGDLKQISDAQKARAFVLEGWNPIKKLKGYFPIAIPLVLMSLRKAQQMVLAMETRGYGAGPRSYLRQLSWGYRDGISFAVILVGLGMGIVLRIQGIGIIN